MAASVGTPALPSKGATTTMESSCSSPSFSPSSDKRFWSNLRSRVDTLLEDGQTELREEEEEKVGKAKRLRQDTALLLRGFDSVAHTLSQLSSNIDNALQGAKDLTKPPSITDIFQSSLNHIELETTQSLNKEEEEEEEDSDKGKKRKLDNYDDDHPSEAREEGTPDDMMLKKAKTLAVSMATKASFLAKQLKSIKSDLSFMQERCGLLEEENEMLRHGWYTKGIRPEEDDLVRLQLEALLSEKSRLANENANLSRENQCLRQLVEYHQATTQDLSATYEEVINGICLDFSSPPSTKPEEPHDGGERNVDNHQPSTSSADQFEFSTTLDKCYDDGDEQHFKAFLKYSP